MHLKPKFFRRYRCDRAVTLGLSLPSFFKILKVAKDDDKLSVTVADEEADALEIKFEARSTLLVPYVVFLSLVSPALPPIQRIYSRSDSESSRISSYSLNLLTIDGEELNIPDQEYHAKIVMPSSEFSAIVKDLMAVDDSVVVHVNKTGLRLEAAGHQAKGEVWVKSDVPVKPVEDVDNWDDDGEGDRTLVVKEEEDTDEDDDVIKPTVKKRKVCSPCLFFLVSSNFSLSYNNSFKTPRTLFLQVLRFPKKLKRKSNAVTRKRTISQVLTLKRSFKSPQTSLVLHTSSNTFKQSPNARR